MRPRMADVKKGQVFMMDSPVRICKVLGTTKLEVQTKNRDGVKQIENLTAKRVEATIPDKPIKGFVSPKMAEINGRLKDAIGRDCATEDSDTNPDTKWVEYWCERTIPSIKRIKGVHQLNEGEPRVQFYVHKTEGRRPKRDRTSGITGNEIECTQVPPEDVPAEMFEA